MPELILSPRQLAYVHNYTRNHTNNLTVIVIQLYWCTINKAIC